LYSSLYLIWSFPVAFVMRFSSSSSGNNGLAVATQPWPKCRNCSHA